MGVVVVKFHYKTCKNKEVYYSKTLFTENGRGPGKVFFPTTHIKLYLDIVQQLEMGHWAANVLQLVRSAVACSTAFQVISESSYSLAFLRSSWSVHLYYVDFVALVLLAIYWNPNHGCFCMPE